MKKTLLIAALALAGTAGAFAQVSYGVKAGVNLSNFNYSEDEGVEPSILTGFNAGVFLNADVAENFSVQPELLYSTAGAKAEDGDSKQKLGYLSLPVLARYQIVDGLRLEVGPQVGLLLSAKSEFEGDETDNKDSFESIDFGLTGGASYQLPVGIGIFARYYTGLTDLGKEDAGDFTVKNNNIAVGLTYTF